MKLFICLFTQLAVALAWDTTDLEIFDLVEDINANFYSMLSVKQDASSGEIRKAYRKLSMQMHPDKNKEEGAEEKFRQINAVYEVLKDAEKRSKYDHVLEFGLPDWRQPVYYYRKVKKLGILEALGLVFVFLTVADWIFMWVTYFERRFNIREVYNSRRSKKRSRRGNADEGDDSELCELLMTVKRPKLLDILPCKTVRGFYALFWVIQETIKAKSMPVAADEDLDGEDRQVVKRPRADLHMEKAPEMAAVEAPVNYTELHNAVCTATDDNIKLKDKDRPWTSEDDALLAKAVAKFPGGTSGRWEKIAAMMNRPVKLVISKAKDKQREHVHHVDTAAQGITGSTYAKAGHLSAVDITERLNGDDASNVRHRTTASTTKTVIDLSEFSVKRTAAATSQQTVTSHSDVSNLSNSVSVAAGTQGRPPPAAVEGWSKNQHTIFEWALKQFPKGTQDRFGKIAQEVPGKSKEECIARFKLLASIIQQKKKQAAAKDS